MVSEQEEMLIKAHLLVKQEKFAEARSLLELLLLRHPDCLEAREELDKVEALHVEDICRENILFEEAETVPGQTPAFTILMLTLGVLVMLGSVWIAMSGYQESMNSERPGFLFRAYWRGHAVWQPLSEFIGPALLFSVVGMLVVAQSIWLLRKQLKANRA